MGLIRYSLSLIIIPLSLALVSSSSHSQTAHLGVLINLHSPSASQNPLLEKNCDHLNIQSYQKLKAVEWAVETINNKSFEGEYTLDLVIHDTSCTRKSFAFPSPSNLIGFLLIGNNQMIDTSSFTNTSSILTSSSMVPKSHESQTTFTTAPSHSSISEGVVALLNQLGASQIALISKNSQATTSFLRFLKGINIPINSTKVFNFEEPKELKISNLIKFLENEGKMVQSVVLLVETLDFENLLGNESVEDLKKFKTLGKQKSWIIASIELNDGFVQEFSSKFGLNVLFMKPRGYQSIEFSQYFIKGLINSLDTEGNSDPNGIQYLESYFHCQAKNLRDRNPLTPPCKSLKKTTLLKKLHLEPDIGFIVNGVSSFSAALRLAQLSKDECSQCSLSTKVLKALTNLNLPLNGNNEIEGTEQRINSHGQLISRKYDLILSRINGKLTKIGQYSHQDGLILDIMLETGPGPEYLSSSSPEEQVTSIRILSTPELYISRVWAMVGMAVAITGVFISLYILVYVLQRMCDGTLTGNQTLGILLLLGIMMMYSSIIFFILPPSPLLCSLKAFVPNLAATTCFAILMLKAMQLRSLVSLGLGGQVPPLNQFINLLFIIGIQLGLDIEWTLLSPEEQEDHQNQNEEFKQCPYSYESFFYLHSYLGLLILLVFSYGLSILKIRRNYNEAKWITLSSLLSLPIFISWSLIVHIGPYEFQEATSSSFFLITASILLFIIFIPKLNTINLQTKLNSKLVSNSSTLQSFKGGGNSSISTVFTTLSSKNVGNYGNFNYGNNLASVSSKNINYPSHLLTKSNLYNTPLKTKTESKFVSRSAYP